MTSSTGAGRPASRPRPDRGPGSRTPREDVLRALTERGAMTQAELGRATGLAKSTVSVTVGRLVDEGLVVAATDQALPRTPTTGRPGVRITIRPDVGAAVGVDFGFRHVRAAVADLSHTVLARAERRLEVDYPAEQGLDTAAELVREVLTRADVAQDRVLGVAAAVPGTLDTTLEAPTRASMMPEWSGVRFGEQLRRRLPHRVFVDNESNLAANAERLWGAGRGCDDFVYYKLHSGVGGALVLSGRVLRGAVGAAGELGHMTLDPAGPLCRCGNRGCLEMYAGIPAVLRTLAPSLGDDLTFERMIGHLRAGEPASTRAVAEAAERVGHAAGTLCNAVNPRRIVLGGSLSAAGDLVLDGVRRGLSRSALPINADVEIVLGQLGRDASALGAIALVLAESSRSR